jgi:Flp pilus assembly protein TadD
LVVAQGSSGGDGTISGIVFLGSGSQPAGQVTVSLRSSSLQISRRVLTDYDGRFQVAGLPGGSYEIVVEEPGCEPARLSANVDGSVASVAVHLKRYVVPSTPAGAYSVSVHDLKIPDKARSECEKGLDKMARNDLVESLRHFTKATEAFPGYYEAFSLIGVSEMKLGDFEKAMQAFQRAIDLTAGHYAPPIFGMGYTSYLQGRLTDAEAILRRGLEVDDSSAEGYFYLAMTLFVENRIEDAEKGAHDALLRKPDLAAAYIVLADVYARRHQFSQQVEALDMYLKLAPNGPSAERVKKAREGTMGILASLKPAN